MPAYVLDTDVLVAAFRSETGASRRILVAALDRQFELLISVPLMLEYEAVLSRPEHLKDSAASEEEVAGVLDGLALFGQTRDVRVSLEASAARPERRYGIGDRCQRPGTCDCDFQSATFQPCRRSVWL